MLKVCNWCMIEYDGKIDDDCCNSEECLRKRNIFPKDFIDKLKVMEIIKDTTRFMKARPHHWWSHGRSKLKQKYCEKWTPSLRERTRAKFHILFGERKCFECGKLEINNNTKSGENRRLSIHHVYYNEKMCCDNSERLLVPLCMSCHPKSNVNREYWTTHFVNKLKNIPDFDGTCWISKKEHRIYRKR